MREETDCARCSSTWTHVAARRAALRRESPPRSMHLRCIERAGRRRTLASWLEAWEELSLCHVLMRSNRYRSLPTICSSILSIHFIFLRRTLDLWGFCVKTRNCRRLFYKVIQKKKDEYVFLYEYLLRMLIRKIENHMRKWDYLNRN